MVVVSVWWAQVEDRDGDAATDLLRAALADRAGCQPAAVEVGHLCPACASADHGRPVVLTPSGRWRVSLSRAAGLVAVVVAEGCEVGVEVGIDVEEVARTGFDGFPAVALHPQERDGTPAERGLVWTRKEAVLKAVGVGLRTAPRSIRVSAADEPAALIEGPKAHRGQRIWLEDIPVPSRYAATLAVVASAAPEVIVREAAPGAWAGAANDGRGRPGPDRSAPPQPR